MNKRYLGFVRTGGKGAVLQELLSIIENIAERKNSSVFIDCCMGGMKVVLNIDKTLFINGVVGNDLEPGIANLAAALKDEVVTKQIVLELEEIVQGVENGEINPKDFFERAIEFKKKEAECKSNCDLEQMDMKLSALYTLFVNYSHHKSRNDAFCIYAFDKSFIKRRIHRELLDYTDVFSDIVIKNENFIDILEKLGHCRDILFYIDPPYTAESMESSNHYEFCMDDESHHRMIDIVTSPDFKATVIISGWENNIYRRLVESGLFRKYWIANTRVSCGSTEGKKVKTKKELIWVNCNVDESILPKMTNPIDDNGAVQNTTEVKDTDVVEDIYDEYYSEDDESIAK